MTSAMGTRSPRAYRAIALLSVVALSACSDVKSSPSSESRMSSEAQIAVLAKTHVRGAFGAELAAEFDYAAASRIIEVRYTLRNGGDTALAVFDRGDGNAIAAEHHALGDVGIPNMEIDGDDVSIVHAVRPLPDIDIASPPTPVAIEVPPGGSIDGRFRFALKGVVVPKRLRWCVAVMRIGDAQMHSPKETKIGRLWSASFAVVEQQQRICTPWYDVASARFDA